MKTNELQGGAYYSIRSNGGFGVAKVLALDEGGVHVRLYSNSWDTRPASISPASLRLDPIGEGGVVGIGHIALTHRHFLAWQPRLLRQGAVAENELDGYRDWQAFGGGYFDTPAH